jgi:hypothetical protein
VSTSFTATTTTLTVVPVVVAGEGRAHRESILPSSAGEIVTFAAAVSSAVGTPTGNVSFYDGGILLGTSALSPNGTAILSTLFEPGSHLFTAAYLGSETLATSQSHILIDVCGPPALTQQPTSQTILAGQVVTLAVQGSATPPVSFQWYRGLSGDISSPIEGATSQTFTPAALTRTSSFWVKVSNDCGSAQSATATIAVQQPRRRSVTR